MSGVDPVDVRVRWLEEFDDIERHNAEWLFRRSRQQGTITASGTGISSYSGIVATGGSSYSAAVGQAPATFTVAAQDVSSGSDIIITGPATTGTTAASLSTIPGSAVSLTFITRSCSAGTGNWRADPTQGTASLTLTSASVSGVTGTFTGTLKPTAGSGASGDKTLSGTFTSTF